MNMGKVIACVNEKGGVAKTTTIKNIAVGLTMHGKKVLVIDLDPSANLTKSFGVKVSEGSICEILDLAIACEDIPADIGIISQEEGIDMITSSKELHDYEAKLSSAYQREVVLRRYVSIIKENYDYVLIDCPAGLGIFVTNALFCADSLIIPVEPQYLAAAAMQNLFAVVALVRKLNGTDRKPDILGCLFTKVRTNTNNDKNVMQLLKGSSSSSVRYFDTYIPHTVKFSESDAATQSIFKYAQNSSAAMIYADLVDEILALEEE